MPANEVTANTNTEDLRPPASVLRTLAFARARGARSSAPDADGTVRTTGIGAQGLAAEALARSLSARALSPLALGSPTWLTALLGRHRFGTWLRGLPNLYYFHWLRAAAEEAATDGGSALTVPTTFARKPFGSLPSVPVALRAASVAQAAAGSPSWAGNAPPAYPAPDFILARRPRIALLDEDEPPAAPAITTARFDTPRSVPLLPDTLNATSILAPMLTLHADTAQARPAAWTEPSLMQFAAPEAMAAWVVRRTETPSRPSPASPERAADSPYMPVSYPPVPLASWLGISASAPEKAYWETAPGFVRTQFSPASSHLLVLPKIAVGERTQPDFDSPALTAFASLPRLASSQTPAQMASGTSASVQAAQSAVVQPTRPTWPPSPMPPTVSTSAAPAPGSAERQAREPSTDGAEEPAAARRSPLAAARTALEIVQRFGTQAAQTLRTSAFVPPVVPTSADGAGRVLTFAALPFLGSLPRRRRAPETVNTVQAMSEDTFFGVPSVFSVTGRATETALPTAPPARPGAALPVLLEQQVARRHQPITTNAPLRSQASAATSEFVGKFGEDDGASRRLASEWMALPLPLVSRAHLAARQAETAGPALLDGRTSSPSWPTAPSRNAPPSVETGAPPPSRASSLRGITNAVLTRATALIDSLVTRAEVHPTRSGRTASTPGVGNPFAAVRSFLGQFTLPRRRESALSEAQAAAAARAGDGSLSVMPKFSPGQRSAAASGPTSVLTDSTLFPTAIAGLPLARRPRTATAPDAQEDSRPSLPFGGAPSGVITPPQSARNPVGFSVDVAARYLGTAGDGMGVPRTAPTTRVATSAVGEPAPALSMLSVQTPLQRFLRLGDLRRAVSEAGEVVQPGGRRRLDSPEGVTADNAVQPGAFLAGQTVGIMSRLLFPRPDGGAAPTQPMLSVRTPLQRFVRLANRRGTEGETAGVFQTGRGRRLGFPGGRTAVVTDPAGAVSMGLTVGRASGALPARLGSAAFPVLSPRSDGEPAPAQTALFTFAAPLRRFLRLGNLRPAESDAAEIVPAAGVFPQPSAAVQPIFGGVPSPFQPVTVASRHVGSGPADGHGPAFRRQVTLPAMPLPFSPRRSASEGVVEGVTPWATTLGSLPAASPVRVPRSSGDDPQDDSVPTVTPMQRFLSRWASPSVSSVPHDAGWAGVFSLPKRPGAVASDGAFPGTAVSPGVSATSSEGASAHRSAPSAVLPFAKRRAGGSSETGEANDSLAADDGLTPSFQAQMLAPIREFLLSTLSRLLSPLEALGQMPDGGQVPADEGGREFRPDSTPSLLWWPPTAEAGAGGVSGALTGRHGPSLPLLGLPTLSPSFSPLTGDAEGVGIQRRVALEAPRHTEFANVGLQALRLASERVSRSLTGQAARLVPDVVAQKTPVTGPHRQSPEPRLPGRPFETAVLRTGGGDFAPTETDTDRDDLLRNTLGLRPLRLPLPSAGSFLPRGGEDGPVRGGDRPLTQAPASLPKRPEDPAPVGVGPEPAWLNRRGGSALAERVPAMPLPLRGEPSDAAAPAAMRDPYVIQRAAAGTAVAAPAPRSTGETADTTDVEAHGQGKKSDVNAMASEVWTILRRKLAREASRSGHR